MGTNRIINRVGIRGATLWAFFLSSAALQMHEGEVRSLNDLFEESEIPSSKTLFLTQDVKDPPSNGPTLEHHNVLDNGFLKNVPLLGNEILRNKPPLLDRIIEEHESKIQNPMLDNRDNDFTRPLSTLQGHNAQNNDLTRNVHPTSGYNIRDYDLSRNLPILFKHHNSGINEVQRKLLEDFNVEDNKLRNVLDDYNDELDFESLRNQAEEGWNTQFDVRNQRQNFLDASRLFRLLSKQHQNSPLMAIVHHSPDLELLKSLQRISDDELSLLNSGAFQFKIPAKRGFFKFLNKLEQPDGKVKKVKPGGNRNPGICYFKLCAFRPLY